MGGAYIHNTSELLALLCIAGIGACFVRWRTAARRDFLAAFALFLAGTLIRELVVFGYGATNWTAEAVMWSASGRLVQIVGAAFFVRAALKHDCGEWGWIIVFTIAALCASVI
jgi:hypothetical protein